MFGLKKAKSTVEQLEARIKELGELHKTLEKRANAMADLIHSQQRVIDGQIEQIAELQKAWNNIINPPTKA